MPPSLALRKPLAYALIFSLFLTGLFSIATRRSYASSNPSSATFNPGFDVPSQTALPQAKTVDEATRSRVSETLGQLPLSFEENRGQVDKEVSFVSRGNGYTLFLTPTEAVLALRQNEGKRRPERADGGRPAIESQLLSTRTSTLRMKLKGANAAPTVTGESAMGVRTNYFKGNDPQVWQTDVSRYERVRYTEVYPGVDIIYYGQQRELEYDFEVAPFADASRIRLEFAGAEGMKVERRTGDLVLQVAGGEVRQHKPVAYQEAGGERREVESRYVINHQRQVAIKVGEYDRTKPLIIDPTLSYSTYLGGSDGYEYGNDIAIDSSGYVYVTGETIATNFPTLHQYQTYQGPMYSTDVFVAKLDTNASGAASLLYSTYLGGSSGDYGIGIAVDSLGNAYVTGKTFSTDFPLLHQYQTYQGSIDAFAAKLDTNASGAASLRYSTYLGGSGGDVTYDIAADSAGNAYVAGWTQSADYPTFHQLRNYRDYGDAFVTKLDTNASGAASLRYSTYLGGSLFDYGNGIAVDATGIVYVTGLTDSPDFPTLNEYQSLNGADAFITKLDTNLSGEAALLYSTYLGGGDGYASAEAIAVDSSGIAYITGYTNSSCFPTLHPFQTDQGDVDAFVAKVDTNASGVAALLYSTYLGGSKSEYASDITVDSAGNVYVVGWTNSTDYPKLRQFQGRHSTLDSYTSDVFVTKLDTNVHGAGSLAYSTYLGGSGHDFGLGIAVDSLGSAYVVGFTESRDFPTKNQYQAYQRGADAFLTKLTEHFINISGRVTKDTAAGAALGGVTVSLIGDRGSTPRTATTLRDGTYSFTNIPAQGNYWLTPAKDGYAFSPTRLVLRNVMTEQTAQNFIALPRTYTIGGVVKLGAAGLAGVTVKLTSPTPTGFTPRIATTNSSGSYSFDVPADRDYTVTPTKTGYQFTQATQQVTDLSANRTGVDFSVAVYSIKGRIRRASVNTGIGEVTVALTSLAPAGFPVRLVRTDGGGYYTFTNLPAGRNYTIKPTKSGFTFSPAKRSITNLSMNIPAGVSTNFTGAGP